MPNSLSPKVLEEVRRNIDHVLKETFQMMFNLDIALVPNGHAGGPEQMVYSHIDMSHSEANAIITIALNKSLLEFLAKELDPTTQMPLAQVVQDIACEINNIASNHLRSYLCRKQGIEFKLSLPRPGSFSTEEVGTQELNMQFVVRKKDSLDLDFYYTPAVRNRAS